MRKRKKIILLCLVLLHSVGILLSPTKVAASMPTSSEGTVYDGVDFTELLKPNNHFYYGLFKHANSLSNTTWGTATYDLEATPILWRSMGEESSDGTITALSEYVLDTTKFHDTNYTWVTSNIKTELENMVNSFNVSEKTGLVTPSEMTTIEGFGSDTPISHPVSTLYIPSMVKSLTFDKITWYVKADTSVTSYIGDTSTGNKATLKNKQSVYWWLRSPNADNTKLNMAVDTSGIVIDDYVNFVNGVRPILKLNPSSVLFMSEIKTGANPLLGETETNENYATSIETNTKNYKLTVLGEDSSNTLRNMPSSKTIGQGDTVTLVGLKPSKTSGDYTINYKIVGTTENGREIIQYGTTPATETTDLSMETSELITGEYTAYVWLQKNNSSTSHEGYDVQNLALTVETPISVPVISSSNKTTFTEEKENSFTVTASNMPILFQYAGVLPTGISFSETTGILSGTPDHRTKGDYPITLTATNLGGTSAAQDFILTVKEADIPINNYRVIKHFEDFNGAGTVSVIIDAPKSNFRDVFIDGEKIDKNYYKITEGSTIVTMNEEYLKTLENKTYDVIITFSDGMASSTLKIDVSNAYVEILPNTGDTSNTLLYSFVLLLAGFKMYFTVPKKKSARYSGI